MINREIAIGVTGTGSLVGQAIIKSLIKSHLNSNFKFIKIGFDYIEDTVGSYWCDTTVLLPDVFYNKVITEEIWVNFVIKSLLNFEIKILFIGIDFELPLFSKYKQRIESETGAKIIVSSEEVVRIADDKYLTYKFLKDSNLPCPNTYLPEDYKDGLLSYPFIIKPRVGASSKGVYVIHNSAELEEKIKLVSNPVIQEMVGTNDSEFTCGVIFFDSNVQEIISLKRKLKGGDTYKATYNKNYPKNINSYLREVSMKLRPEGVTNFQLRIDENGQPKIFEINARHSGTTYMRALLGFNEITYIIEYILGLDHKPMELAEATVVRYFEEFLS
jgi:carbamoyl-phosphate synthase large subunit